MTPLALASTAAPAPSHPFLDGGGAQRRLALWHGRVDGRSSAMNFTIDSAGRIVIPVQVRREAGLLPGALQKNAGLKFLCRWVTVSVATIDSACTNRATVGQKLSIPVNHFEGNYTCDAETLAELRGEDRIVFTYVDNPNGSVADIAGICNAGRNVVGLMPHPERACDPLLGGTDGRVVLESLLVRAGAALTTSG